MKVADETVSTFNAGASMLGYLYQVRVTLLWAIRQSRAGDFSVSLETLDSVEDASHLDGRPPQRRGTGHGIEIPHLHFDGCDRLRLCGLVEPPS